MGDLSSIKTSKHGQFAVMRLPTDSAQDGPAGLVTTNNNGWSTHETVVRFDTREDASAYAKELAFQAKRVDGDTGRVIGYGVIEWPTEVFVTYRKWDTQMVKPVIKVPEPPAPVKPAAKPRVRKAKSQKGAL
ncbi:MAG: hypothetical protein KJ944_08505 [Alphaproteobacteria bacterium]|nr:hypothetical protein [Alphaproteobacteria bacterium]MBU1561510.1 hypothetical protein [Alphaproteobacteria bacterium]MBU2302623.1 hypothetical protein [Alphaproteobacteria bacterium]MBU2368302.1 hypothetical protein [Alphaproteobacteria bacterium]